MSRNARRHHRGRRHRCSCGRKAVYYSVARGRMRARRDHPYCPRCWRAAMDQARARSLPSSPRIEAFTPPPPPAAMSMRQRAAALAEMQRTDAVAVLAHIADQRNREQAAIERARQALEEIGQAHR